LDRQTNRRIDEQTEIERGSYRCTDGQELFGRQMHRQTDVQTQILIRKWKGRKINIHTYMGKQRDRQTRAWTDHLRA
jgi:hypothetical protein